MQTLIKKINRTKLISALCMVCIAPFVISWGMFGHERINHAAVLSLPAPLRVFFYNHIDFVTQESTVPDLRKYTLNDTVEYTRHYVDLENFGPQDSLPETLEAVKKKYSYRFLAQNGTLPWYMREMMDKLTKAFKQKRKTEILFIAADLGHYIGDAHMPLHTTVNYDGQLTGQKGLHSFWEAHLPELFGKDYTFNPTEAKYIDNVYKEIWSIINNSHSLIDSLLWADRKLKETFPADKIYMTDASGKIVKSKFNQSVHSAEYSKQFHTLLHGMVEKQMAKAITATSSFWYTAWVNAGKPDLSDLDAKNLTDRNAKFLKEDLALWKKGKLSHIESEKEY